VAFIAKNLSFQSKPSQTQGRKAFSFEASGKFAQGKQGAGLESYSKRLKRAVFIAKNRSFQSKPSQTQGIKACSFGVSGNSAQGKQGARLGNTGAAILENQAVLFA
jgi:hypothetical protein